jgi:hypothetical protein
MDNQADAKQSIISDRKGYERRETDVDDALKNDQVERKIKDTNIVIQPSNPDVVNRDNSK